LNAGRAQARFVLDIPYGPDGAARKIKRLLKL
jgi:hypothetical protein